MSHTHNFINVPFPYIERKHRFQTLISIDQFDRLFKTRKQRKGRGRGRKKLKSKSKSLLSFGDVFNSLYSWRKSNSGHVERARLTGRNKFVRLTNRTRKKRTARRFSIPPAAPAIQSRGIGDELRFEYSFHASRRCSLFRTPCVNWREQQARRMREEEIRRLNDKKAIFSHPRSRKKLQIHYPMIQVFVEFLSMEGKSLKIIWNNWY